MEIVEIEIGYDYQVLARHKRKRDAQWTVASSSFRAGIPSVSAEEAPEAGILRLPGSEFFERYRAFEGRLYREVDVGRRDVRDRVHVPLSLDQIRTRPPLRAGNVGSIPWKWMEKDAHRQYDAVLAEIFESREAESLALAAPRARDLLVVEGLLYVPSPPPMIEVPYDGRRLGMMLGERMEDTDPEFHAYGNHYHTLFRYDRADAADAFAATVRARHVAAGTLRAPDPRDGPPAPPAEQLVVAPGAEHLFLIDDMVESARRTLAFPCTYLNDMVVKLEPKALRAFAAMREAVFAMERPEGRTRGNARAAYEAICVILESQSGGWCGPSAARAAMDEIEHCAGHLRDRYRTDPAFAPGPDETLAPEDENAMRGLQAAL